MAEKAEKERAAIVYATKADLDDVLIVSGILLGDAPAQVDVDQSKPSSLTPILEFGEHSLDEIISLSVHVIKGAADEDEDFFPADWLG